MNDAVASLETLYREVGPSLLAYLQRGFGDVHSAEDLLQETFVQAARWPERLARAVSARAWLFAIARNVAVTALRRRRITRPLPAEMTASEPTEDPRQEDVRAAVAALPDGLRAALELRLREDLSYEEIATVLQIPVGTVRSRLHHALKRVRSVLSPGADSEEAGKANE